MSAMLWLVVALVIAMAVLLAAVGWAACMVGGTCDVRMGYDEGEYGDEARHDVP